MSNIPETVLALRAKGLNCAQTVAAYGLARQGAESPQVIRALLGFGGGFGCGATCGCIAGGAAMLGLGVPGQGSEGKALVRRLSAELLAWFQKQYTWLDCASLKKPPNGGAPIPCNQMIIDTCAWCHTALTQAGFPPKGG